MVTMKMRRPYTTASIWSSGKVTCTGANSEDQVNFATIFTTKKLHNVFNSSKNEQKCMSLLIHYIPGTIH